MVNKADGELAKLAERTRGEFTQALSLVRPLSTLMGPFMLDLWITISTPSIQMGVRNGLL